MKNATGDLRESSERRAQWWDRLAILRLFCRMAGRCAFLDTDRPRITTQIPIALTGAALFTSTAIRKARPQVLRCMLRPVAEWGRSTLKKTSTAIPYIPEDESHIRQV